MIPNQHSNLVIQCIRHLEAASWGLIYSIFSQDSVNLIEFGELLLKN